MHEGRGFDLVPGRPDPHVSRAWVGRAGPRIETIDAVLSSRRYIRAQAWDVLIEALQGVLGKYIRSLKLRLRLRFSLNGRINLKTVGQRVYLPTVCLPGRKGVNFLSCDNPTLSRSGRRSSFCRNPIVEDAVY